MKIKTFILAITFSFSVVSKTNAENYSAQIDALQNELLKIKQQMNSDKSKAYFKKGKGLSISSMDGKYSFQIKGRAMWDMSAILGGNDKIDDGNCSQNCSRSEDIGTFGQEFRRLRFTIKGELGDGWGFAFQPDFAETISDDSSSGGKGVDVKDALIYKSIKGGGKFSFGNVKSAGGFWENTSSNSLLFMERPMYNEAANLAHRAGIHYDTAGVTKPFHMKISLTSGNEGAWRQEQEDGDTIEDHWNISGAAHYTWTRMNNYLPNFSLGKNHKMLVGASWTYEHLVDGNARSIEARANGVHTLGEKIQDSNLANIDNYTYGGPQIAYTNGPLFLAGEYYFVHADRNIANIRNSITNTNQFQYGDYRADGYSAFIHYFLPWNIGNASVPISEMNGAIDGVKCKDKNGCTAAKIMYEGLNFAHSENSTNGTDGKILHFGINHYFNSDVRLMIDAARGIYQGGTGMTTDAVGTNVTHNMSSVQARLHLKW